MSRPERAWRLLVMPRDGVAAPLAAARLSAAQLYAALRATSRRGTATQLLLTGHHPGDGELPEVALWLRAETGRLDTVAALVHALHPDLELAAGSPPLAGPGRHLAGRRWVPAGHPTHPVRPARPETDPMATTLAVLGEVRPGETGALSLVLAAAPARFAARALAEAAAQQPAPAGPPGRAPRAGAGSGELAAAIRDKAGQPAFRVTLRSCWLAPDPARAAAGHAGLAAALGQLTARGAPALRPARERPAASWAGVRAGTRRRWARLVLSADELAGLVHLPAAGTVVPHLQRTRARRHAPDRPPADGALHLADSLHRDRATPVGVGPRELLSHAYLIGPSGTGKTTLLARLVTGLAGTGTGALVLDPHGDLARQLLAGLPDDLLDRVDLVDLADPDNLPTINPLWLPVGEPRQAAVARATRSAAVRAIFTDLWRLDRASTPNLLHFLSAALDALLAAGDGRLTDLPRLVTDGAFRADVVGRGGDRRVRERWAEFAAMSRDDRSRTVRAIINKAAEFDRNPVLATVFGDPGPGLRVDRAMDAGRIVLVSLPRGLVPEGTVSLIGSVLVSLAYQAALAREGRPEADRPPVIAVIDEFQEFALSAFAQALTATRKYGLGLVVANQNLSRIRAISPDLLDTLLANVATLVAFRTAPGDARALAGHLAPYDAEDLAGLARFESYWRLTGPAGPHVVAARTRPPDLPRRSGAELDRLAARLRVPGRPLAAPGAVEPDHDWEESG